ARPPLRLVHLRRGEGPLPRAPIPESDRKIPAGPGAGPWIRSGPRPHRGCLRWGREVRRGSRLHTEIPARRRRTQRRLSAVGPRPRPHGQAARGPGGPRRVREGRQGGWSRVRAGGHLFRAGSARSSHGGARETGRDAFELALCVRGPQARFVALRPPFPAADATRRPSLLKGLVRRGPPVPSGRATPRDDAAHGCPRRPGSGPSVGVRTVSTAQPPPRDLSRATRLTATFLSLSTSWSSAA